jgi:hypothetical protein
MSKGSGISRADRRRNARKERLRALLPRDGAAGPDNQHVVVSACEADQRGAGITLRGHDPYGDIVRHAADRVAKYPHCNFICPAAGCPP